ncbi:MAG: hypothetical protein ACRCRQ_01910, partial [Metamycoplasmataceae bacterium]
MEKEQKKLKSEKTSSSKQSKKTISQVEQNKLEIERTIQINSAIQVIEKKFGKESIMLLGAKPNVDT